jgi:hypothetical protein
MPQVRIDRLMFDDRRRVTGEHGMDDHPFKAKQAFCTRAGRLAILTELAAMPAEPAIDPAGDGSDSGVTDAKKPRRARYFRWASRST